MRFAAFPLILLASSPALAADQFDLACQGKRWTQRGGEGAAHGFRVRVDLAKGQWCEGECKAGQPIVSADADKLVLTDDSTLNTRMEMIRQVTFDRKKSVFIHHFSQYRPDDQLLYVEATCKTEPFTPIPAG